MSTTKEEFVAATILQQVAYLDGLLNELNEENRKDNAWLQRIKDVELKLRHLRKNLES